MVAKFNFAQAIEHGLLEMQVLASNFWLELNLFI
jgi:hypothetical protein